MKYKKQLRKIIGKRNYMGLRSVKKNLVFLIQKRNWNRRYKIDLEKYMAMNKRANFDYKRKYEYKILGEWEEKAGVLGAYFWQDLWAAQHIYRKDPKKHYDIGSRIDGFIGHLVSFRKMKGEGIFLIDVRPLETEIPGVQFIQGDAKKLDNIEDDSVESLSSLCALEHFGLGRYGDEIDPDGCFKALKEMQRILCPGGFLYLSVPVGREHVEFNAHRIFYPQTIVNELNKMDLVEFSTTGLYEDKIRYNEDINRYNDINTKGLLFGLFVFQKK